MSVITGSNGAITLATINSGTIQGVTAGNGLVGGGTSGTVTLTIDDSKVATISGSTFTGTVKFNGGLSGSLTSLTDGSSYLVAGSNVTISTGSSGAVTIASSSPPGTVTGTGTTNYLSKFTGTSTVGNSALTESSSVVNITSTSNNAELRLNNSFSRVAFIDSGGGWAGGYNIKGDASPFNSIQHDSTGNAAGVWYSSTGIQFYANDSQAGGSSPAEVMRIASAGKVGIGTTGSSTARLQVQGTSTGTDTTLLVKHNVADGSNLPVLDVQNSTGTSLLFISGSGGVGISTNNPLGAQFYVSSSLTGNAASALIIGGQVLGVSLNTYKGQTQLFQLANGTTEVMRLNSAANVGIGTGTYTARLFVSGSSTATTPTIVARGGVASPTGPILDVQNYLGATILVASGSGNVGIGTSNPTAPLNVFGTSTAAPSSTVGIVRFLGSATNALIFGTLTDSPFSSYVQSGGSGTYPLSLNPLGGNVGIGTTTNLSTLTVNGGFSAKSPSTVNASTYSVTTTDYSLRFTTTNCTVTLPTASSFPGRILIMNTITANSVTSNASNVIPLGSDTAGTSILAATLGKFTMIQSNGTNWVTLMSN